MVHAFRRAGTTVSGHDDYIRPGMTTEERRETGDDSLCMKESDRQQHGLCIPSNQTFRLPTDSKNFTTP